MKKLFYLFAMVLVASAANAQVSLGPKAGVNFSNFTNTTDGTTGFNSWIIGAQFNWNVSDKFALGSELYYNQVGAENNQDSNFLYVDYLSLPIQFKYRATPNLNIYVGPDLGFLLSADANEDNVDALFKGVNISVGPGVQYLFDSGLAIDARYNLGLSDAGDFIDSKINSFAFTIAYLFKL